ncbi:PAS domain-containing protein [Rufibacter roseus]|uniref:histidine kinase n=1 Tax=Rufibacter roseus TaxID=1567108 RepID=A0ABW2DLP5_9BACT|nr:PAS domain-containing protein [Rufibacter roseus]
MVTNPDAALDHSTLNDTLPYHKIFESQSGLVLVLSSKLTILAATDAYLRETLTVRKEIIGRHVFDVFPDNPELQEKSPSWKLKASFDQVLSTGQPHQIDIFQYDIPDPAHPGQFLERYWETINTPVHDAQGNLSHIIHETKNVTESEKAKQQLNKSIEREKAALTEAELQRYRLERLFEQAPAAMAMLEGPELVFKVLNSSYQQLFPGRKLKGLPLFEALPELREQVVYDIMQNVYTTGETFEGKEILIPVARYQDQPVEDIYWNFIYQALYDANGQVNGILIFALDVTEFVNNRQQVEKSAETLQALNRSLEERVAVRTKELESAKASAEMQWNRLKDMFMQAPTAICILDGPELTYQLINPVYQKIFPGRELLNKPLMVALPELEGTPIPDLLQNVYRTGETYVASELPVMLARHQGGSLEEIYWNFTYQARYNSQGEIDGVMVFAYEVTDQVQARKAVEDSARQLRLITDSLPVLISYLDKEERYQFTNKAYETWFPMKTTDLIGKRAKDVLGEKAYDTVKGYMTRTLAGEKVDYEATMPYRDGFTRHTKTSFVPDVQNGKVEGFYAMVMDVTDQVESRKKAERSAQEAKAMALEAAKANEELRRVNKDLGIANKRLTHTNIDLDNFIYAASHDLKAPITNIEMLLDELLRELPQETLQQKEVDSLAKMMQGSIERFKKTISSLTEITKLQKENSQQKILVDLAQMVEEVKLDLHKTIVKSGAQIEVDVETALSISFSEKNLRSIVYNLLSNAIKYRHPDRIPRIAIRCHTEEENLVLTVQDNGLGLSTAQQEKLFSMFRRFHDHVEGTGVGLYMVKRIVDNAGGKIKVESTLGEGSTFSVSFKKEASPVPVPTL